MAETRTEAERRGPVAIDNNLVVALSHPLRISILEILHERVASPREIAEELGAKVGDVSYHVAKLRDLGAAELVRTEPRRGTVKHFYRATSRAWLSDEAMKLIPTPVRRELFGGVLADFWTRVRTASEHGGFDRTDVHASSTLLDLDQQAYDEVVALMNDTLDRIVDIQGEVHNRRASGESDPADSIRTEAMLLHYERPPAPERRSGD